MNELKIFENAEFGSVRTVEIDGKVFFAASDIAKSLGYANPRDAILRHCKGVVKHDGVSQTTNQYGTVTDQNVTLNVIPEGDVYRLIVHSKLPSAQKFEHWVFDEVLPSIRKHGMYAKEELLDNPDLLISVAQELKAERERNKALEAENKKMRPAQIFADAVSASDSTMLVRDVAKMIRQNGVSIGEKRFYKWLREHGYICQNSTTPTQKAMELGLFEIVVRTVERGNGLPIETKTTKVTGKGQEYFVNKFLGGVL